MKKTHFINLILCAALLFTGSNLYAQKKFDFSQFEYETTKFVLSPLNWDGKDFLTAGCAVVTTALIMPADHGIKTAVMRDRSYENKGLMRFGTIYGDATPSLILGAGLLAHGLIAGDSYTKQFGFELVQSIAYTGAVILVLKSAIGRQRPGYTNEQFNFSPFALSKGDEYQSCPSGHSSIAFAVSTVFASKVKSGWLKALCYTPAVITAVSRVYNNRHWASDVVLGAFIGHFIGQFVVNLHSDSISMSSNSLLGISIKL